MRQAATEVDMEITNIQPPKLAAETKFITGGPSIEEPLPEAEPVTIDIESDQK
jgi:hypothetical protein